MFAVATIALGGYLLGSIPVGYLAGQMAGIDVRKVGSCNIGATNVMRILGKGYGYSVFLLDFLKGVAAVGLAGLVGSRAQPGSVSPQLLGIVAAACCVVGHAFPVWLRFKGGKGVATSAGALFGLIPSAVLIGAAIWSGIFWFTRYVSVASIATAVALPAAILILSPQNHALFYFSLAVAALVIFRHRSNLSRLLRGTEPRFKRK